MDFNQLRFMLVMEIDRRKLVLRLLGRRDADGVWRGRLSSSALSTAVAIFALGVVDRQKYKTQIQGGIRWLCSNCNGDGGWGDTVLSESNISTTLLCWSALTVSDDSQKIVKAAERWIVERAGSLEAQAIVKMLESKYGGDRSFSSPILSMCALAGRLGDVYFNFSNFC
ncbi:hypothetical protein ACFL3G_09205, partial [Planctomycetota bacterium]